MEPPAIWSHFESLTDPRVKRTRRHELQDIVVISILAVTSNADGWSDIVEFAETKEAWLRTFLALHNWIPCDDTFRRVFAALDPEEFQACFVNWVKFQVADEVRVNEVTPFAQARLCRIRSTVTSMSPGSSSRSRMAPSGIPECCSLR
jgi:hypothetical protein